MTAPIRRLTAPKPFTGIRRFARRMRGMVTPKVIELNVHIAFDDEADVWYVAASDVPGLSLEADNPQLLIDRITKAAPQLIALNQDKLQVNSAPRKRSPVAVKPVFDSPLQLACA